MNQPQPDGGTDPLAVGMTRPPMRWGVTYSAIVVNAMLTMQAFLLSQQLLLLFAALPIHGISMLLCAREPRWFELAALGVKHRIPAMARTWLYWRASSYTPLRLDLPRGSRHRRRHELHEGPRP
jgi:type IV secretion system protein VirB3